MINCNSNLTQILTYSIIISLSKELIEKFSCDLIKSLIQTKNTLRKLVLNLDLISLCIIGLP